MTEKIWHARKQCGATKKTGQGLKYAKKRLGPPKRRHPSDSQ